MRTISFAAALLAATALPAYAQTPDTSAVQSPSAPVAGINPAAMDRSVTPGNDFYDYANGTWQKNARIPADRSSTGAGLVAYENTEREQKALLDKLLSENPAPGSNEARIKDYYTAYMNTGAIDAAGMTPLKADFARYAAITNKRQLVQVMGDQTESDLDLFNNNNDMNTENLFGLFITKSLSGPDVVPYLYQGGLGLPDRAYYLSSDPKMATARTQYRTYIAQLLKAAGISDADARAQRIFDLETKIARADPPKADMADFTKGGTLWTRADFAKNAPGMDWNVYFDAARMPRQKVFDAYAPSAIKGIAALVGSQPLQAWKDWLIFHRINANTDVLPQRLDALHFAFYGTQLAGIPQQRSRAKRALSAINADLGNAFGKLYVEAYFPPSAKAKVEDMVRHIKAAFARRIAALDWMSPATKKQAEAKLKATVVSVGYPDHWLDYSMVKITPTTAYANRMSAIRGKTLQQLAKLGKPQDRGEWWMNPQLINAVNLPVQNALNFPAAILQKPFFDPNADAAFNYGAIGAVIGHEISHSFDASGAKVDASGDVHNWWTKADMAHFEAETKALVDQYSAYAPFPDLHLNGKLELGENGADVAGLAVAFDAYRASLNGHDLPVKDGLTGDQRFFVAFAQAWSTKTREGAERQQIISNAHAPGKYRAMTVRNNDAWYKAFDVTPGQALYLPPAKRVELW